MSARRVPTGQLKRAAAQRRNTTVNKAAPSVNRRGTTTVKPTPPTRQTRPSRRAGGSENISGTGYLAQPEREQARLDRIESFSGPKTYKTTDEIISDFPELAKQYERLKNMGESVMPSISENGLTLDQFQASMAQLGTGSRGVDPFGFRGKAVRDDEGNLVLQSGTKEQFTGQRIQSERPDVFGQIQGLGEIDKSALDRLVKSGMTEEKALETIRGKRPDVQEAFKMDRKSQLQSQIDAASEPIPDDAFGFAGGEAEKRDAERTRAQVAAEAQRELAAIEERENAQKKAQQESELIRTQLQSEIRDQQRQSPEYESMASGIGAAQSGVDMLSQIAQSDPDLNAIVAPQIIAMQQSVNMLNKSLEEFAATLPTDKELEAPLADIPELQKEKQAELDLAERIKEQREEEARIARDMNIAQKALLEERNREEERQRISDNIQNEKILRTRMNRLGIETDTGALDYFSTKVEDMNKSLESLKNVNDIEELMANMEIGRTFHNQLKEITNSYDASRMTISKEYNSAIAEIRSSVTKSKADKYTEYAKERLAVRKKMSELATTMGDNVVDANNELFDRKIETKRENRLRKSSIASEANAFIDNFGTQSPGVQEQLRQYEIDLGLAPGSLRDTPTMAERKLKKASGTGGANSGDWVQKTMAELTRNNPYATKRELALLVASRAMQRFPGTSGKNEEIRTDIYSQMAELSGEPIIHDEFLKDEIYSVSDNILVRERILSSDNPSNTIEEELESLTEFYARENKLDLKKKSDKEYADGLALSAIVDILETDIPGGDFVLEENPTDTRFVRGRAVFPKERFTLRFQGTKPNSRNR